MSVEKEADERVDKARESNKRTIEELGEVVLKRCYGYEDHNGNKLSEALILALHIRELLGG